MKLAGSPNFRDLGGTPCADGGLLRRGVLFRADALLNLSAEEFAQLQNTGLHTVIDLRSAVERERRCTPWPQNFQPTIWHWDVNADAQAGNQQIFAPLIADPTPAGARNQIQQTYRLFPAAFAPNLSTLFKHLLSTENRPVLFHCAIGKDRTGFLAALLLSALGASREAVVADYMMSKQYIDFAPLAALTTKILQRQLGFTPAPEIVEPMITVHPDYLIAAFEAIDTEYGSTHAYLQAVADLSPQRMELLRERLLLD